MEQTISIDYKFTTLNEYIKAERTPRFGQKMASNIKKKETEVVMVMARRLKPIHGKVDIEMHWRWLDRKVDPDNIAFCKKYVMDGLVKAGVLKNDGWNNINSFKDTFELGSSGVDVTIKEVNVKEGQKWADVCHTT